MDEQIFRGALAVTLGVVVGVLLFVPFVALSYRRRGGFGLGRFALWVATLVYLMAIWTYTLLPLPDPETIRCAGVNLDPFAFIDDLRGTTGRPGRGALNDPAVLQLLLNVLLFVPLGFFLRVLGGRGILFALLVGLGVSALVETTQLTGVWWLYPCAYRVFDVDDLLANTVGALLGSVLALLVPRRHWGTPRFADAEEPRPVTSGRRYLAMACDVLAAWITGVAAGVKFQVVLYVLGADAAVQDGTAAGIVGSATAIVVWLIVVLVTGRTIGDIAVQLRFTGGPLPPALARPLRFAGGIGGYLVLLALPGAWGLVAAVFAVGSAVLVLTTPDRRGLPGLMSGQRLVDAREPRVEP
ncbi:VanZ family protein [Microbacterium sp. HD4P20]|uniref:VanZ family protein n=1 Tax=Microbacterium sp. HD4P20 TaxID=2864874 RepID=UPI001C63DDC4|nr:VanZ family protein [Microbacterium sp. HD4P20]MCP2638447.1 VanZ family protein [Microbacterium sp. HD4P20]